MAQLAFVCRVYTVESVNCSAHVIDPSPGRTFRIYEVEDLCAIWGYLAYMYIFTHPNYPCSSGRACALPDTGPDRLSCALASTCTPTTTEAEPDEHRAWLQRLQATGTIRDHLSKGRGPAGGLVQLACE